MLEVFIFESEQLLETLEDVLLQGEKEHELNSEQINEVFRIMHTIKGSASMMSYENPAKLAHAVEDMFDQIRGTKTVRNDWDDIFEIVLEAADLLKADIANLQRGSEPTSVNTVLIEKIHRHLDKISGKGASPGVEAIEAKPALSVASEEPVYEDPDAPFYKIKCLFEADCMMENMRAFSVVTALKPLCIKMAHIPEDLMVEGASEQIIQNGFILYIQTNENPDSLRTIVDSVMFLQSSSIILMADDIEEMPASIAPPKATEEHGGVEEGPVKQVTEVLAKQNFISVNINKLDKLMDLVGEIVTTESMVTKNPEIEKLQIEGFERSAQQLRKHINELQDIVTSMRMVPVSSTFHKMQRIVRDMCKKVQKDVDLIIIGEETEVDKNIIDTLSDPLMHLIRNSVDHGIEHPDERVANGKPATGKVTLEARNTGGDVIILVSDDGGGLDRDSIIAKAYEKGLTTKAESEISDAEAYSFIFLPGFSTNVEVTEYSGRGVGMDVVRRNLDKVKGTISVESQPGKGTTMIIRIPLTLAIIEGMKLRVGNLLFIVPMLSIQQSFKPDMKDIIIDPDGREMIMIRGEVFPIIRLHRLFNIDTNVQDFTDGILIMLLTENNTLCLFVDNLIGEQQAVIKPLPTFIQRQGIHGISGCALLGDGSISLIIDINNLVVSE